MNTLFSYVNFRLDGGLPLYLAKAQKAGKSVRTISTELEGLAHVPVGKSSIDRWLKKI